MPQKIAQTRQIVADYVWVVNGIEYIRNGPTLHSKNSKKYYIFNQYINLFYGFLKDFR
jgi:hypothetical protein